MELTENQFKLLLAIYNAQDKTVRYSQFGRDMDIPKYEVSRIGKKLEELGLIVDDENNHPRLTAVGEDTAASYNHKFLVSKQYLHHIGVDEADIENTALTFALNSSKSSLDAMEKAVDRHFLKTVLPESISFSGAKFCRNAKEGFYDVPIRFIKLDFEPWGTHSIVSPISETFKEKAGLYIHNRRGWLFLYPSTTLNDILNRAECFWYWNGKDYVPFQPNEDRLPIPIDSFSFVRMGQSLSNSILKGDIELRIDFKSPESDNDIKSQDKSIRAMLSVFIN